MIKRLLIIFMALIPLSSWAVEERVTNLAYNWDLDSTTVLYPSLVGESGQWSTAIRSNVPITISSSNGNVTATTALTAPFTGMGVGDVVIVRYPDNSVDTRVIITFTDTDTIVVNSAFTTSTVGIAFKWLNFSTGATANDGWVAMSGLEEKSITFQLDQVNVTGGIDMRIECQDDGIGATPVQVFPSCASGACNTYQNYTTAGITSRTKVVIYEPWGKCRLGAKIGSADDGGDLTTNAEQITVIVSGTK